MWGWDGRRWNVIDTGEDIKALQLKYNVPDENVYNEETDIDANGNFVKGGGLKKEAVLKVLNMLEESVEKK